MRTYARVETTLPGGGSSDDWRVEEGDVRILVSADEAPEDEADRKEYLDNLFDQVLAHHRAGLSSGELHDPSAPTN